MSAIAGLWRFDGKPGAARDLAGMLAALRPYGPHDTADWAEGTVALGRCLHRTLPQDRFDHAPQQTPDGRLTLVADVRLDNREELAAALGQTRGSIDDRCDAALLLDCLDRWGERAVDRLVGDFAFACWDASLQTLTLARDFRGNRPLYFHRGDGMIAVASMAKGLHALADVPYEPDLQTSADYLMLLPAADTPTFWQGIERVPPGTILSVTRSAIAARRYWQPKRPERGAAPRDYVEGVRHHLDQAVAAPISVPGGTARRSQRPRPGCWRGGDRWPHSLPCPIRAMLRSGIAGGLPMKGRSRHRRRRSIPTLTMSLSGPATCHRSKRSTGISSCSNSHCSIAATCRGLSAFSTKPSGGGSVWS